MHTGAMPIKPIKIRKFNQTLFWHGFVFICLFNHRSKHISPRPCRVLFYFICKSVFFWIDFCISGFWQIVQCKISSSVHYTSSFVTTWTRSKMKETTPTKTSKWQKMRNSQPMLKESHRLNPNSSTWVNGKWQMASRLGLIWITFKLSKHSGISF